MAEDAAVDTLLVEMKSLRLSHNADIVVDLIPAVVVSPQAACRCV